jgi:hypothetical protein
VKPFEDQLRRQLGEIADSYTPQSGLSQRVAEHTRHRAATRRAGVLSALGVVVVLAATAVFAATQPTPRTKVAVQPVQHALTPLPTTTTAGAPTTTILAAPSASDDPPRHYLAGIGAGNEKATVVETATNAMYPVAAAPSAQLLWALSGDGRTLYAPSATSVCPRYYSAIDLATGANQGPAFSGVTNLDVVAPSPTANSAGPNNATFAYTQCGSALVHIEYRSGGARSLGPSSGNSVQLSWSPDGSTLAWWNGAGTSGTIWLATVATGNTWTITTADQGCRMSLPRLAASGLFAVELCPETPTDRLLLMDPVTGAVRQTWALITEARCGACSGPGPIGPIAVSDLTVDPSGQWALYAIAIGGRVSSLALRPGATPQPTGVADAYQLAWLPDKVDPATAPTAAPPNTTPPATTAPTSRTTPTAAAATTTVVKLPSCSTGAPTTPYFVNGCVRADASIEPPG